MSTIVIRPIQKKDNIQIAAVIRQILIDMNVPKVGTAYADPQLDCMFETYSKPRTIYYVIETQDLIIGGAGIGQLENEAVTICELQKMYFLPEARGLGLGHQMIQKMSSKCTGFRISKMLSRNHALYGSTQQLYKKGF